MQDVAQASVKAALRDKPIPGESLRGLSAEVVTVSRLVEMELCIPVYQRPYKWTLRNADQLLGDIWRFRDSDAYRLGTVILHGRDIVDGQQRYLTLALLLLALLDETDRDRAGRAERFEALRGLTMPTHGMRVTQVNLQENFQHFRQMLRTWPPEDREELLDRVLDRCEVVVLRLSELDAAFQMFDSQNTRGRALFPTDLLKAFHIREMGGPTVSGGLRGEMVALWESIPPESINALFSDYLFRIRRWSNGQNVPSQGFATRHVDMFKGIREGDAANALNRWSMPYLYAKNFTDDFEAENDTLIRYGALRKVEYPFQIDQPVINGETFFELVSHYYRLGLAIGLFPDDSLAPIEGDKAPFAPGTMKELADLRGSLDQFRKDRRFDFVVNLIECLVMYYLDRFDGQNLSRALRVFLRSAMGLRAEMQQLQWITVDHYALGRHPRGALLAENLFDEIRQALRPSDFLLRPLTPKPSTWGSYQHQLESFFSDDFTLAPASRAEHDVGESHE